jgi:hypothetical protein
MKFDPEQMTYVTDAPPPPRMDMYASIHKALRACMTDTLLNTGRMDPEDDSDVVLTSRSIKALLDFCEAHLRHENAFVHTAIEARAPGASAVVAHEHEEHQQSIRALRGMVSTLEASDGTARAPVAMALYRQLALFVANNFIHMQVEETAHNAVLWSRYTDAELLNIHNALVASIPPAEMMHIARWMVPFMNPAERTGMLSGMQREAPAPAFAAVIDTVRPHLKDREWLKLARSLALPPVPGLVGYA